MTQWTAFVGFTGLVLSGFLLLARLSQEVVDANDETDERGEARTEKDGDARDGRRANTQSTAETDSRRPSTSDAAPAERATESAEPGGESTGDRADADEAGRTDAWSAGDQHGQTDAESTADRGERRSDARSTVDEDDTVAEQARPSSAAAGRDDPTGDQSVVADPATPDGPVTPTRTVDRGIGSPSEQSMSPGVLLANVALTQGLFGGLLAAAAWYFGIPGEALGLWGGRVEGLTAVAVGVAFGVVLWVGNEVATGLADEVGAAYDEGLRSMLAPEETRGWALLLGVTLPIIALVEEFLFRAAAIGAPSAAFGGAWALAVVSSVAFALGHGAQGRVGILVTGALGFALAAGFVLTGSFLAVVVAHYLVNALEFTVHEGLGVPDPIWARG